MATVAETSTTTAAVTMSADNETDKSRTVATARELPPSSDMFHAAACGARDWLSLTLKRARKPLDTDKHGLTVLHVAAFHGHVACLELLLEDGCVDVNVGCRDGRRPVHMVLTAQSRPNTHTALLYLLEHGAHANVSTDEGLTPLHLAATEGLMDCTETLVRNGADTHAKDTRGHTPLDLARIWGHRVIARFLKDVMWRKDKQQEKKKHKDLRRELIMMQKTREKCVSVLDLPRLGRSGKITDSPWTEVMLHLSEELKPGHY